MEITDEQLRLAENLGGGGLVKRFQAMKAKGTKQGEREIDKLSSMIIELIKRNSKTTEDPRKGLKANERSGIDRVQQIVGLNEFKRKGKVIPKLYSHRVGRNIAVISRPEQRKEIEEGVLIYTVDEAILIAKADWEEDLMRQEKIAEVKEVLDGELIEAREETV